MIKVPHRQTGSIHIIIIVILVVALFGALGFVFWKNLTQSSDTQVAHETSSREASQPDKIEPLCASSAIETDGVFCSESIGVEFEVPEVFEGEFQKKENYDVYKGPIASAEGSLAGQSLDYYEAVIASGQDETLSLSVAKEPLRSGYSSIGHALQRTYFNATSGNLHLVKTTSTGKWIAGESVPSFSAVKTKIYNGKVGDAGTVEDGYLMVVNDYLVVIKIKHVANPMNEPALDSKSSFMDLNSSLRQLKVLER